MKCDVKRLLCKCVTYKQAKSNIKPHELCAHLPIFSKPWVNISMDFVFDLPRSKKGNDLIFVIVGRFSKIVHLISSCKIDNATHIVELLFREVLRLYVMPTIFVSD